MCAACVAQGVAYMGGALASLQVMGARAKIRRRRGASSSPESDAEVEAGSGSEPDDEQELATTASTKPS